MKELKLNLRFILVAVVLASMFFGFFNAVLTLDRNNGILLAILCYAGFPIVLGFAAWKTMKDANWMDKGLLIGALCIMVPCLEDSSRNPDSHFFVTLFIIAFTVFGSSFWTLLYNWPVGSGWRKLGSFLLSAHLLGVAGVLPIALLIEYVITGGGVS